MMKDDEIKALARWPEKKRIPAMGIPHKKKIKTADTIILLKLLAYFL